MKTADFSFDLPPELIAQAPCERRDSSRLLRFSRSSDPLTHHVFSDIVGLLRDGDRLVFNDTRVIPARVMCHKPSGGAVELLFARPIDSKRWSAMVRPGRRLQAGAVVHPDRAPEVGLRIVEVLLDGNRVIELIDNDLYDTIEALIETAGDPPLPPYVERAVSSQDRERYQTVYARVPGAVAAPTAGLHFTSELLAALAARRVDISYLTLHVGLGTFKPVKELDPRDHQIHRELFEISAQTAAEINATKKSGGRIIAVGTTSVRVLEFCARSGVELTGRSGECDLYILPGFEFRIVDAMITNFHLPHSTLLMLVSAFAGRERILRAYEEAVRMKYRFFSYGDAMLIE